MTLGAFASLGVPEQVMIDAVNALSLPGCKLSFEKRVKNGISATKAVVVEGEAGPLRHLPRIQSIIENAQLSAPVKKRSLAIFHRLAEVEAEVHAIASEKVHFHEIGAADTLVDVVGNVAAFEYLAPEAVYTTPVRWGTGGITISHGEYPLPAPATALLLNNIPGFHGEHTREWTTPTGAALLANFITSADTPPGMRPVKIGYGAGEREHESLANVLRIICGEIDEPHSSIFQIETQVDDMTAEELGYLHDILTDSEALDWFFTPVQMKKNRPGTKITLLCRSEDATGLQSLLLRHTSTIGVRYFPVSRQELPRRVETMATPWGEVRFKIVSLDNSLRAAPEYEDCRRIAAETRTPVMEVRQQLLALWNENKKA